MDELAQLDGLTNRLTMTCPQLDAIHRAPPHWIRIAWGQGRLGLRHSRTSLSTFPQRRSLYYPWRPLREGICKTGCYRFSAPLAIHTSKRAGQRKEIQQDEVYL